MQYPIVNDFLKLNIDGHTEPQLVPKLLLKDSIQELHNIIFGDRDDGGLKEDIDAENNTIISDSKFRSLLPLQFFTNHQDTRSCVVVSVVYLKKYTLFITIMV